MAKQRKKPAKRDRVPKKPRKKRPAANPSDNISTPSSPLPLDSFLTPDEFETYFIPAPRGRPAKDISLDELERACRIMPTDEDLALMFDVDVRTIERRKKNKAFRLAMERGKAKARGSLRRAQFRAALSEGRGAITMLIWLGKQHLGQKDKIVNEHTGLEGGPIEIADVRKRLDRLIARRAEPGPAAGLPPKPE